MRSINEVNEEIHRCKKQIDAVMDLPIHEQCEITLEGFQRKLKFLLNEKSLYK